MAKDKRKRKRITKAETEALERAEEAVARSVGKQYSDQPRFSADKAFADIWRWARRMEDAEPAYDADARKRDAWLRDYMRREPHLLGVLNSVVQIDKNRGWTLTGGRNQVYRYTDILHQSMAAEDAVGWRSFVSWASQSYYTADLGCVVELGRDGQGGPLRRLYTVDPAQCKLTGNLAWPMEFYQSGLASGKKWDAYDYFRIASMSSTDASMNGLGYCALSRALELVKILVAIYRHDQEKLGAKMPMGLMLLKGISESQWRNAMARRESKLNAKERDYYGGLAVIATEGDVEPEAQLIALSELPPQFDRKNFVDQTMYGYALCFGYDPREFWPVSGGALGTATETQVQHAKATGKGGLDFALALQEKIQMELPETLDFEFEQRDQEGERLEADVAKAKIDSVVAAYMSPAMGQEGLITREEARTLLVEQGVIPGEWTEAEEDIQSTDTEERLRDNPRVRAAALTFPDEPIVQSSYKWVPGVGVKRSMRVLWETGAEALKPRRRSHRLSRLDDSTVLYDKGDVTITQEDVERAIAEAEGDPELAQVLEAPLYGAERIGAMLKDAAKRALRVRE